MKFYRKSRVLSGFMAAVLAVGMTVSFGVSSVMRDDGENSLTVFPGAEGGRMYTQGARAGDSHSIYRVAWARQAAVLLPRLYHKAAELLFLMWQET